MKTKRLLAIILIFILVLLNFCNLSIATQIPEDDLDLSADAVYLIDNKTNKVLYSKNSNNKMYPASTTKILSAIIVLENCNLNDIVTASYTAIMSIPDGYSTVNIKIGEQLTVEQLLELLLVCSANDAANVLAEFAGGSIESFVSIMNTKLNELNLTGSHFTNPYGLHDEAHYTTARDMAYLMKYCLKNDTFRKLAGKASCSIPGTNLSEPRNLPSTNELVIPETTSYYKYLTAGKTGFTTQAKECLVSSAYRDDLELIGVVLGSDNRFSDTRNLYQYIYSNYSIKQVAHSKDVATTIQIPNAKYGSKDLDLLVSEDIFALMNNDVSPLDIKPTISLTQNILAPIKENAVLGKIKYEINGVSYTTDLIASNNVEETQILIYSIYFGIGVGIVVLLILIIILINKKNK